MTDSISWAQLGSDITGDVLSFQLDVDARKLFVAKNGIYENNGDPVNGTGESASWTTDEPVSPFINGYQAQGVGSQFNFGQGDPDGENNFTDGNGRGGFRHEPPQGYVSLCTANLKDVDYAPIGPNSAAGTPDKHFDTLIWSGDGTSDRRIGGLNFQPDLIWGKVRDSDYSHALFDSVRGVGKQLYSDSTAAEAAVEGVTSFNADGVTVGSNRDFGNESSREYVAWAWKAGNGTVVDTSGDLPATRSTNVDAGFSIILTEGTDANDQKIPHGLGKAPEWIMAKQLDNTYNWDAFHVDCTAGSTLILNTTAAQDGTRDAFYNAGSGPVDSQFIYSKDENVTSGGGKRSIIYAWTSIEGYSKFGSYEGNSNADNAFVYLGFRPAWVMIKNMDTIAEAGYGSWVIHDKYRPGYNTILHNTGVLYAESTRAEGHRPGGSDSASSEITIDMLSNGFKVRNSSYEVGQPVTYIYIAFAEMPFKYANAR